MDAPQNIMPDISQSEIAAKDMLSPMKDRGKKSIHHHRGTPLFSVCRLTPRSQSKKSYGAYHFPGKTRKRVYTIGPERRVYTIEPQTRKKKNRRVSTVVVYTFFFPEGLGDKLGEFFCAKLSFHSVLRLLHRMRHIDQERKRQHKLKKIVRTPAGCPWNTRRDKQGSTGRCPSDLLGHQPGVPATPGHPKSFQKFYVIFLVCLFSGDV